MNLALTSVLSLWISDAISSEDVVAWADRLIMATEVPSEPLFELSLKGPEDYLKLPSSEVPHPEPLSYLQEFSIRTSKVNLSSPSEVERVVKWIAGTCLGEDLGEPEVRFSYEIYFFYVEKNDMVGAKKHVLGKLPDLLPTCRNRAAPFWNAYAQQSAAADRRENVAPAER
jgi:hypothetical protein